jgi:Xaa-Pro aminopeptidase
MEDRDLDVLFVYSYRSALTAHWTGYCPRHSVTNASLLAITDTDAVHLTRLPLHVATAERSGNSLRQLCAAPHGWAVASVTDLVTAAGTQLGAAPGRAALAAYEPEAGIRFELELRFGPLELLTAALVDELIGVKDADDLASVRRAAAVAQEAFDAGLAALRPGRPPAEAVKAAETVLRDHGSVTWHCFAGATDAKGRSLLQSTSAVLEPGGTGFFEVIPDIEGFCPEIVSTLFVGDPAGDAAETYGVILDTLRLALDSIGPEMSFGDLYRLMIEPLLAAGAAEDDITRLGHSTGLDNIELPEYLDPGDDRQFRSGRVISIHPNVRKENYGALFRGGTAIVTDTGCEPLFSFRDGPIVVV